MGLGTAATMFRCRMLILALDEALAFGTPLSESLTLVNDGVVSILWNLSDIRNGLQFCLDKVIGNHIFSIGKAILVDTSRVTILERNMVPIIILRTRLGLVLGGTIATGAIPSSGSRRRRPPSPNRRIPNLGSLST